MESEQLQLAHLAHFGQQEVALVAVALGRGQGLGGRPGAAVVLPLVEPTHHGLHVGVAEVPHRLGRKGRAHPAGAVDDDRARLVRQLALDLELEMARGRWTALGMAPCSYSSGSRTSRNVTPPPSNSACASAWSTSRMDALAWFKRSRGVATLHLRVAPAVLGRPRMVKHYQRGQHSQTWLRPAPAAARWETAPWSCTRPSAGGPWCAASPPSPVDPAWSTASSRRRSRSPTAGNTGGHGVGRARGPRPDRGLLGRHDGRGVARTATRSGPRPAPGSRSCSSPTRRPRPTSPGTPSLTRRRPGLGAGPERWPVPYWHGDAAFGVMAVLLGAVDAGLGACVLGAFRGRPSWRARLGVADGLAALLRRARSATPTGATTVRASLDRSGPAHSRAASTAARW